MRREFSKEFKRDAISLVIEQGYSRVEAAMSLGIHSALLSRWVREYQTDEGDAFRGKGKLRPEQEEIRQLRSEKVSRGWRIFIVIHTGCINVRYFLIETAFTEANFSDFC